MAVAAAVMAAAVMAAVAMAAGTLGVLAGTRSDSRRLVERSDFVCPT